MTTALTWIEIKLLAREPLTLVVSLLFPVVLMLLLLASFGSEPDEVFAGLGGTDFYVPSYLGAAIAVMGFAGIPTRLASYRQEGVLRRFRAAGVPASSLMASQVVMTAVLSVAGAAVMLALAYTGFDLAPPVSPLGTVLGFAVGVVAFAALGLFLGSMISTARAAQESGCCCSSAPSSWWGADHHPRCSPTRSTRSSSSPPSVSWPTPSAHRGRAPATT